MSRNISTGAGIGLNRTSLGTGDQDINNAIYEFKIFNITIASLALCILVFTGVFWSISHHSRIRQRKQARAYEAQVGRDRLENMINIVGMERTHSMRNAFRLLRRQDTPKDNSGIYFIYSNQSVVMEDEGTAALSEENRAIPQPPAHRDPMGNHAHSGILLDPSTFYMQL